MGFKGEKKDRGWEVKKVKNGFENDSDEARKNATYTDVGDNYIYISSIITDFMGDEN